MTPEDLQHLTQDIVQRAVDLCRQHNIESSARVNYACIFTQSDAERAAMLAAAHQLGDVIVETPSGPIFCFPQPLPTVAGPLRLLKIRKPDPLRPERGDADFTLRDYAGLRALAAHNPAFAIVTRPECEMLELISPALNIRAYFSDKPIDEELGVAPGGV